MRMITHLVFGAGFAFALLPGPVSVQRLSLAVTSSLVVNLLIDELGHVRRRGRIARSPLTHSLVSAPAWGAASGYALWFVESRFATTGTLAAFVWSGVAVACAHLALDSMTERGVYVLTKRAALAHFRSGNGILNLVFVLIGAALFLV